MSGFAKVVLWLFGLFVLIAMIVLASRFIKSIWAHDWSQTDIEEVSPAAAGLKPVPDVTTEGMVPVPPDLEVREFDPRLIP